MSHKLMQRTFSFALSAALTLAMLGSIDHLSQPVESGAAWAQHSQPAARA